MEFLTQIFDTIYENFFDPKKRVFVGYLFSAIIISFLWLCIVKKNTLTQCFHKIFDKKIFLSNRTIEKAENIKKKFNEVEVLKWGKIPDFDIVINATSVGLKGESLDLDLNTKDKVCIEGFH